MAIALTLPAKGLTHPGPPSPETSLAAQVGPRTPDVGHSKTECLGEGGGRGGPLGRPYVGGQASPLLDNLRFLRHLLLQVHFPGEGTEG